MTHAAHLHTVTNSKGHTITTGIAKKKTVLIVIRRTTGKEAALVLSYKNFKLLWRRVDEIMQEFNE